MSLVARTLSLGSQFFTTIAVLVALITVWQWVQYLLWVVPSAFVNAVVWSLLTSAAVAPVLVIDYFQNEGE